jgi:hypothetical protein
MEGGCRRFFAISMLTSARPGQASANSRCPMTGPALALLNARTAFRPAAMKAYIAKKMTSASTVTEGQADP